MVAFVFQQINDESSLKFLDVFQERKDFLDLIPIKFLSGMRAVKLQDALACRIKITDAGASSALEFFTAAFLHQGVKLTHREIRG